jgi:hypothetical protein
MGVKKTIRHYAITDAFGVSTTKVPRISNKTGIEGNHEFVSVRNGSDSTWSIVDETSVFIFRTHKVNAGALGTRFFEEMIIEENGNVNIFIAVYSDTSDDSVTSDSTQVYYAVSGSQDYDTATITFDTKKPSGQKVRTVVLERGDDDNSSHDSDSDSDSDCDSKAHDDDKKKNKGSLGMSMGLLRKIFD